MTLENKCNKNGFIELFESYLDSVIEQAINDKIQNMNNTNNKEDNDKER